MYKKTATDVLDEYIDKYEGRSRSRHYTPRVSDLLSPKPKFDLADAVNDKEMSKTNSKLLNWINESYKNSVRSTCSPLYTKEDEGGFRSSSPTNPGRLRSVSYDQFGSFREVSVVRSSQQMADELSSLPSPRISEVDLDSDKGTVETDVLLSSYHEDQKGQNHSSWKKSNRSRTTYPKWVDNVNEFETNDASQRRLSSVSVLLKTNPPNSLLSHSKSMDTTGLTMDDAESIATDVILDTSIYGNRPVNMGGNLHTPLFQDKRVEAILNKSRKKVRKQKDGYLARSLHSSSRLSDAIMSPENRDVTYTNQILNRNRGNYENTPSASYSRISPRREAISSSQVFPKKNSADDSVAKKSQSRSFAEPGGQMSLVNSSSLSHLKSYGQQQFMKNKSKIESNSFKARDLAVRLESSSFRPDHGNLTLGTKQRENDKVEANSQRTSGYHSDVISPLNSQTTYDFYASSKGSPQRAISPVKDGVPFDFTNRLARKDSNSTDVLLRRPPTGTKVHQRSKTWSSQSFSSKVPNAVSTPKPSTNYRTRDASTLYVSERPSSLVTKTISSIASPKAPPSSSPHSTSISRAYQIPAAGYLGSPGQVELPRRNRLSDSAITTRSRSGFDSYTNWRSSALRPERSPKFVVRKEIINDIHSVEPDDEKVLEEKEDSKVVNTDFVNSYTVNGTEVSEINGELGSPHNRTWPSLEKFKKRISQYSSRNSRNDSSPTSWTASKRSIPLRVNNASHSRPAPQIDVPMGRQFSKLAVSKSRPRENGPRSESLSYAKFSRTMPVASRNSGTYLGNDANYYSDDDNETIDTDLLLAQPPMPIVDASPSLSTVSDETSTIKGSDSGESGQSFVALPVRSSSRVSFAPDASLNRIKKVSPHRKFESTTGRSTSADLISDYINKSVKNENEREHFRSVNTDSRAMRSELLDSFIEDCMRNSNNGSYIQERNTVKRTETYSAREEPRTVETLKHLLLNLNDISASEEKAPVTEVDSDYDAASGNTTDDAADVVGEQSLARAYHHLERLKSLINSRVENRSDVYD
ncbi:uncharacterized protein LOC135687041 isoform X2 [Rhopilema esculentum]|uniref:uncharacterized protein LOC135687041 isoform X2 n=1 Tax=Rhopilema esculentum TaxID=499914 RepID=UPI0031CEC05B